MLNNCKRNLILYQWLKLINFVHIILNCIPNIIKKYKIKSYWKFGT